MSDTKYGIKCEKGELIGSEIPMEIGDEVIVGRNPKECNLVYRDLTVSRKVCHIKLLVSGEYEVTDYSEAGIRLESGETIIQKAILSSRTKIVIGNAGSVITLL